MKPSLFFATLCLLAACAPAPEIRFQAGDLDISVSSTGQVTSLVYRANGGDILAPGQPAPLLSLREDGALRGPETARWDGNSNTLTLTFPGRLRTDVRIQEKGSHASLEVIAISDTSRVELVLWGPYPTVLDEVIGETVGVVQGGGIAVGLQALNPRTLGGYLWNENDAMPQLDIFESGDYSDLSEEGKRYVLYRVEAAKPDSFGSTLQAYTRNRSRSRIIPNMEYDAYLAPAFDDGGVVGSRIALFGSSQAQALNTLGKIELAEGLPHPMLDGVWAKQAPRAAQAYVIMPFSEKTADAALDIVERAGMQILYHPDPFSSWGQFTLRRDDFPNGVRGLRAIADKAHARGMRIGGHTLSNFIHTHDDYVSPVPDPRLARVGSSTLMQAITKSQATLQVQSPEPFREGEKSTLRTVVVGGELIQYGAVSDAEPWELLDLKRGAFGTSATAHTEGSEVALLADHGYRVFLSDPELTIEMAQTLGRIYAEAGMQHISFDGLEGNRSTGMGNYGEILFAQTWFDSLPEDAREDLIITASRTSHYFWHLYTRMNWGEPWYAGFRESQTEYRMKNQAYFKRNFMPGMLGWFSLRPETSLEDIEWMLARSAAYDAGYALSTSMEALNQNGRSGEMLEALARWERARLSGAFSEEQKERMKDVAGEFHLEETEAGSWTLFPVAITRHTYQVRERQPGEPTSERADFQNDGPAQPLVFSVTASQGPLTDLAISFDGVSEMRLPGELQNGQTLSYSGGSSAAVLDAAWNQVREVATPTPLTVKPGMHYLAISAESPSNGTVAKLEIRVSGAGEAVKAPD